MHCMRATLVNNSHLDKLKAALVRVPLLSQQCKSTKSVEIVSNTNNTKKKKNISAHYSSSELHMTVIKDTLAEW